MSTELPSASAPSLRHQRSLVGSDAGDTPRE
jgi:hypothetical protein